MHHDYACITSRIAENPTWWDEHGVPRYAVFAPSDSPNIYAREVALLLIECQACGHEFRVGMTSDMYDRALGRPTLHDLVLSGEIHYGDPPNIGCCPSGPTMNSVPRRVLEFWRTDYVQWSRVVELEVELDPKWMRDDEDTDGARGRSSG